MEHNLSGREQQMLAIGRTLMTNPKGLILDKHAAILNQCAPAAAAELSAVAFCGRVTHTSGISIKNTMAEA